MSSARSRSAGSVASGVAEAASAGRSAGECLDQSLVRAQGGLHRRSSRATARSVADAGRRRAPVRPPPIDPFPQHGELRRGQLRDAVLGLRPGKTPALEDLLIEAEPLAIPRKELDPVAHASPECELCPAGQLLPRRVLGQRSQAGDALPHIRRTAGQIHANAGADHAASTTLIRRARSASPMPLPQRICWPSPSMTVTAELPVPGAAGPVSAQSILTGRNVVASAQGQSSFRRSSRRHW